jgi:hypothetical protein
MTGTDYQTAAILEDSLKNTVYGQRPNETIFINMIEGALFSCISLPTINEENTALRGEISRVKSTVSWQITKPLRFFSNIILGSRKKS